MEAKLMNKFLSGGLVIGVVAGIGGSATDTPSRSYSQPVSQQRVVCHDEVVQRPASGDEHRIIGTVTGAALGGLVGNQFAGGNTNKALTAAGVVAGGYAGNQVQE